MSRINENIIKNVATEVTRDCLAVNVNVEVEFVGFLIELLTLNPKYGKQFEKTLNRAKLEKFVNEVVALFVSGDQSLNTLKMQFVMLVNYDKIDNLIKKNQKQAEKILSPLVEEILEADPDDDDEEDFKRLYRKICIYILLASGLGSTTLILNLKETFAALESVYQIEELYLWLTYPREEKLEKLQDVLKLVSGVRLYNRSCKLGGDLIPDLPTELTDTTKACLQTLSNSLISVMQRVNTLSSAVNDQVAIEDDTGNTYIKIRSPELTEAHYKQVFDLLVFNRQYEMFIRNLLKDMEDVMQRSKKLQQEIKAILDHLHMVCKYKSAMPIDTVFPLFRKLWGVWRSMQDIMFLVSTITRLMNILGTIKEHMKIPYQVVNTMLEGRPIENDNERMSSGSLEDVYGSRTANTSTFSLGRESLLTFVQIEKHVQFLGFCAVCLCQGALVPCNIRLGMVKYRGKRYGFCSFQMAARFSKEPERYINEVLNYARNNPQLINLLKMRDEVERVWDVMELVKRKEIAVVVCDKEMQTQLHLKEKHIDLHYTSNLWEWKRRACKWATITNCRTHSTQTNYSHMRSEHHCQTVQMRDQMHQTHRDAGMMTNMCRFFVWGLRGQNGYGQHSLSLEFPYLGEKLKAKPVEQCRWPCIERGSLSSSSTSMMGFSNDRSRSDNKPFYVFDDDDDDDDDE